MTRIKKITVSIAACCLSTAALAQQVVGTIPGSFDVTLSGSARYTIPIRVAPGTAGVTPQVSLDYDSQALSGALGAGWSIGGLSKITRGPKDARFDGTPDGVRLQESDALYLDGQRLVAIQSKGAGSTRTIEYRKAIDDQTRVLENGADFDSATFVVNTKGGLTIEFDSVPGTPSDQNRGDVRLSDGTVLLRAESRVSDSSGNYIDFFYLVNGNGNYDIKSIRYTGHSRAPIQPPYASIDFDYETAPRAMQSFVAGRSLSVGSRLLDIVSHVASKPSDPQNSSSLQVSRYTFDYDNRDNANRYVLKTIHQFGEDDKELTPTTFTYSTPEIGWKDVGYSFPALFAAHEELANGYRFAHINTQNSLPDLIYAAKISGQLETFTFQNNGTSWTSLDAFKSPVPFVASDGSDLGVIIVDVDGDGRADILQSYQVTGQPATIASFVAGANGWGAQGGYALPFVVSQDGKRVAKYQFAKWTGAAGPDLLYQSAGTSGFLDNTASGWKPDDRYKPPFDLGNPNWIIDVDCSGTPALFAAVKDSSGAFDWKVYRFDSQGWKEDTSPQFKLPFPASTSADAIRIIAVDSSPCVGVLVASAQGAGVHAVYQASPTGWKEIVAKKPPFDLVNSSGQSNDAIVAPFMGDGLSDVIANTTYPDGHSLKLAYLQTATGWQDASATFSIPILATSPSPLSSQNIYVGDLTGNGRSDLLFPGNSRNSFGRLFLATDSGFAVEADYAPPVAFAKKGSQDQGVRALDLNAHGLTDVLVNKAGDASPSAWFNTGTGWTPEPGLIPPVAFAGTDVAGNPVQFVDVDGDGFVDMLYSYRDKTGAITTKLFRNVPSDDGMRKWSDASSDNGGLAGLVPPAQYPFAAASVGDMGVRFADLAGTGRPYMLVGYQPAGSAAAPVLAAFRDDGHSWVPAPEFTPPIPFVAQIGPPNAPSPDLSDASHDLFVQIVDVNGDGLPDIVAKYHDPKNPSAVVEGVWLNTGHGWSKDSTFTIPVALDTLTWNTQIQSLQWDKNASVQWADVNGDGIPDIVYTRREGANNESTTYLGTGAGWIASGAWQIPIDCLPDRSGDPGLRIIDVNGDGYPDLLYARQEADGTVTKGLLVNSGAGWITEAPSIVPSVPFVDKDGNDLGVRLLDLDGSGLLAIVQGYAGDTQTTTIKLNKATRSDTIQEIDAGFGQRTTVFYQSLITPISPTLGQSQDSLPTIFSWPGVYSPDLTSTSYPIVAPVPASYVVRRTILSETQDRQIAFSYRYGGYRVDALGKSGLGFAWRDSVNEANGLFKRVLMSQDVNYAGKVLDERTCWINLLLAPSSQAVLPDPCSRVGTPNYSWILNVSSSHSDWKVESAQVGGGGIPSRLLRQISLAQSVTTTFELDGNVESTHKDTFEYDEPQAGQTLLDRHLNILRSVTAWGDGFTTETDSEYDDDITRWFLGRLTRSTVTRTPPPPKQGADPHVAEGRSVGFSYDSGTGLLTSQTVNLGTLREVTTTYTRDVYGNVTQEQLHANGIPDHGPTVYGYDLIGRYQVSITNALLQKTTQQLSLTTGLPLYSTDINGVTVAYKYDGLGRLIQTDSPTSAATSLSVISEYLPLSSLDASIPVTGVPAVYAMRVHTTDNSTNLPYSIKLMDVSGRTVRTISEGFHTNYQTHRYISRDTTYDIFGHAQSSSVPYEGLSPAGWNSVERDVLGRVVKRTAADGGVVTIAYSSSKDGGITTTVVDHRRRRPATDVVTRNMRNLPILVTDVAGKHVTFDYNAGGQLTKIRDPLGNVTQYTYDDFGNRIAVQDPDVGRWNYDYDSLGRLIRQIDSDTSKTQVTKLDYDALNRVKHEIKTDAVWTWDYDSADHGLGKLSVLRDDAGNYTERYTYDEVGRVDGIDISVDGKTYTSTKGYDSFGRIHSIGYPDNFTVNNVYDNSGFLTSVDDASTGRHYWSLNGTNAFGDVTDDVYGNGVTDSNSFDPRTDRPLQLRATAKSKARIVNLLLTYDIAGDLRRRVESVQKKTEAFDYDDLDRLISLTRPDRTHDNYLYDDGGRFTSKAGMNFAYGSGAMNQTAGCTSTPLPAHGVIATSSNVGHESYTYDCHGNMTSKGYDLYYYNSDGRLFRAEHKPGQGAPESVSDHFDYTPSGARYRELARHGARQIQTISVSGYEEVTEYGTGNLADKPCFVRYRWILSNLTGPFAVVEKSHQRCNGLSGTIFHEGAKPVGNLPFDISKTWYLHKDQLGSVLAVTDEAGKVRAQYWYDPWGSRIGHVYDDIGVASGARLEDSWSRGFTGHEHIEDFDLIHMNGRVYDPHIGAFTSPDPINESLDDSQLYDPYTYVRNNPLRYTDPSGYCFLGCFWQAPGKAIAAVANGVAEGFKAVGNALADAGKWVAQNWRTVVIVAAVVAVTVVTAGTGGPAAASLGTAILSGMAAGATAGALSAALYGGNLDDILTGALKGAVVGAVTGAAFYGVGSLTAGGGALNDAEGIAGHGLIGGAREAAFGGNFWHGFESGAVTKGSSLFVPTFDSGALNVARAAVVGGGVAAIGGGNFANGAFTGAFSYAFNDAMHPPVEDAIYPTASPIDFAVLGAVSLYGAAADFVADLLADEGIATLETSEFADAFTLETSETTGPLAEEQLLPDEVFSSKAPYETVPGTSELSGQHINDLGQVQPWRASYDEYGRIIARTDYNAGNIEQGIADVHHHTFEWGPGMSPMETGSHIPGPWPGH